jgi:myosin-5
LKQNDLLDVLSILKQLVALKSEAKSASRYKEISYKLENKVVELTQNLQQRTGEKKALLEKLNAAEAQIALLTTLLI